MEETHFRLRCGRVRFKKLWISCTIIQSVDFTDDYDGSLQSRRTIIYTLSFEMKLQFYGPLESESAVITQSQVDLFTDIASINDSAARAERLTSTPTPVGISADSDFGFNTIIS